MARSNDSSPYPQKWTNEKLIRELTRTANLEDFGGNARGGPTPDEIREATRLYRESWMQPIIDEIAKRFIKVKK